MPQTSFQVVWRTVHREKTFLAKVINGAVVRKNGRFVVRSPALLFTIRGKNARMDIALTPEEVSRLKDVLGKIATDMVNAEIKLYAIASEKNAEARQQSTAEEALVVDEGVVA